MVLPTYFRTEITLELQKILKYPYFVIKKKKITLSSSREFATLNQLIKTLLTLF